MRSCKQTAELVSQGLDRRLIFTERLRLRFHLMMCAGCRNFSQQVRMLRNITRQFPKMLDRDD